MLQNLRPIEIIALLAIVVLLFGAKKLPELAKGVGQSLKIFRKEVKEGVSPEGTVGAAAQPAQEALADSVAQAPAIHPTPGSPELTETTNAAAAVNGSEGLRP